MFARFYGPKKILTQFENCKELTQIASLLQELRNKKDELNTAGQKYGAQSTDFRKHEVIANLIVKLDEKIAEFNAKPFAQSDEKSADNKALPPAEKARIIELVKDLENIIRETHSKFYNTLMLSRNNYQDIYNGSVLLASYAATYGAASTVTTTTFGASLMTLLFAPPMYHSARSILGTENLMTHESAIISATKKKPTASIQILEGMMKSLAKIGVNFGLANNWNILPSPTAKPEFPDEYLCSITFEPMTDPVICTLDGRSYQRENITRWLEERKVAPNRVPLPAGQSVESVLITNRNLKDLIEAMQKDKPQDDIRLFQKK
jgi:hypothetical protein